jgi:hypothetical protein
LPKSAFLAAQDEYDYSLGKLRPSIKIENGQTALASTGSYSASGTQAVPGRLLQTATFEGFITTSGVLPSASSGSYSSLGFWEWEYYINGSSGIIGPFYLRTTSPTGLRRPDPPSVYFPAMDLASETKIILTPPSTEPVYVNGSGVVSVSLTLTRPDEQITLTASVNTVVSSEPGFTEATASVSINEASDSMPLTFSSRQIHFAFTVTPGTASGYLDGQRLTTTAIPVINSPMLYDLEIATLAVSSQDGSIVIPVDPFLVGDSSSSGSIRVAEASRHSISGLRFTPGRALYSGSSFTPPTSITRLA